MLAGHGNYLGVATASVVENEDLQLVKFANKKSVDAAESDNPTFEVRWGPVVPLSVYIMIKELPSVQSTSE